MSESVPAFVQLVSFCVLAACTISLDKNGFFPSDWTTGWNIVFWRQNNTVFQVYIPFFTNRVNVKQVNKKLVWCQSNYHIPSGFPIYINQGKVFPQNTHEVTKDYLEPRDRILLHRKE